MLCLSELQSLSLTATVDWEKKRRGRHRRCELCFILLTTLEYFHPKEPLHTHTSLACGFYTHCTSIYFLQQVKPGDDDICDLFSFPSQRYFWSLPLESLLLFSQLFIFFSPWQLGKKKLHWRRDLIGRLVLFFCLLNPAATWYSQKICSYIVLPFNFRFAFTSRDVTFG